MFPVANSSKALQFIQTNSYSQPAAYNAQCRAAHQNPHAADFPRRNISQHNDPRRKDSSQDFAKSINTLHPKEADTRLSSKSTSSNRRRTHPGEIPELTKAPSDSDGGSVSSSVEITATKPLFASVKPEERTMSTQTDFSDGETDFSDAASDTTATTAASGAGGASASGGGYVVNQLGTHHHNDIEAFRAMNYHTKSSQNLSERDFEDVPSFTVNTPPTNMNLSTTRLSGRSAPRSNQQSVSHVALSAKAAEFSPAAAAAAAAGHHVTASAPHSPKKPNAAALNAFAKEFNPSASASASADAQSASANSANSEKSLDVRAKPFVPKSNSISKSSILSASATEWTPPNDKIGACDGVVLFPRISLIM